MPITRATVTTDNASLNLKKLCRHFSHKAETQFDDDHGEIRFSFGTALLDAQPGELVMQGRSDSEKTLARLEEVIAGHLVRFASKESLTVEWQRD